MRNRSFPGGWAAIPAMATLWLILAAGRVGAQPPAEGKQWALLIAVGEYAEPQNSLRFPLEDARLLRQVLMDRAGVPADQILVLGDAEPAKVKPTLENLRREIPAFLARAGGDDRVLVCFSGHGLRKGEQSYLVPADFRSSSPLSAAMPIQELREALDACPARVKFLVLDCCHAGGGKAPPANEPAAEELARDFLKGNPSRCVVLASCKAAERSWEWSERQKGVFTYWFARALEGGADKDANGELTADEVYEYTHERVIQTTTSPEFRLKQTPMRELSGVEGVPVLLTLKPEPPESVCRRLAELLDLEIRRRGLKKVAVLEFLKPSRGTEGLARAELPAYCAEQVRRTLAGLSAKAYEVLGEGAAKGFQVEEIGDPAAMQKLAQRAGGMDAVVGGTLRRRGPNMLLQCDLMATADGNSLATPAGLFPLSADLVTDGTSVDTRTSPPRRDPYAEQAVQDAEDRAREGHPLLNPAFPYRVELWSIQPAPGEAIGPRTRRVRKEFFTPRDAAGRVRSEPAPRQLAVWARDDERFEIRVENRGKQPVLMTLLVDGLNTLGKRRERPGQGWSWALEPGKTYTIDGWWTPRNENARPGQVEAFDVEPFRFTDVARSEAGRQGFGSSIGVITAAFYEAKTGRALGVGADPAALRQQRTSGYLPGDRLAQVEIRYVDERERGGR